MRIGQEGDDRRYRPLRKSDYYMLKKAETKPAKYSSCPVCGRRLDDSRKSWGGYCFECKNEPL